jgi:hypothetical protein
LIGVLTSSVLTSSAPVIHRFFIGFLSAGEKKADTSGIGAGPWASLQLRHPALSRVSLGSWFAVKDVRAS